MSSRAFKFYYFIFNLFILCLGDLSVWMLMHQCLPGARGGQKRVSDCPESGVTDGCQLLCGC